MTFAKGPLFNFTPEERRDYEATTLRLIASAHIENYLEHVGLQAKDLARRIRKSKSWVSKLLSGRQNATLDTLAEVAWALGARWQLDLVSAERTGTPAENDLPAPTWMSSSTTTTHIRPFNVSASERTFGSSIRPNIVVLTAGLNRSFAAEFGSQSNELNIMFGPDISWDRDWFQVKNAFSVVKDELGDRQSASPEHVVSSATASLQISSGASNES